MATEKLGEELVDIDTNERSIGLPHMQLQVYAIPCHLETMSLKDPLPINQGLDPKVTSGGDPQRDTQGTDQEEFPLLKYFEAAESAFNSWLQSLETADNDHNTALFGENEGCIKFSKLTKRKVLLRKGYGVLLSRMLITIFMLPVAFLLIDINWIWRLFTKGPLFTSMGVILIAVMLVVTVYQQYSTQPHATSRVLVSGALWLLASLYIGLCVVVWKYVNALIIYYALIVTAALSLFLMLYMAQSKLDFTVFRALLLCAFIVDTTFYMTLTGSSLESRAKLVPAAVASVVFSMYLVYDTHSNLRGTRRYSLLMLLASQWTKVAKSDVKNVQEDLTSLCLQQEVNIPEVNNEKSHLQTKMESDRPEGDAGFKLVGENKLPIDDSIEDVCELLSARKAFTLKAYTFLVYHLLITKYIFGCFVFRYNTDTWLDRNLCITCSATQFNILVFLIIVLYLCYKTRWHAPKRWLISMGIASVLGNIYIAVIAASLYIHEIILMAVVMGIFVCLALMLYLHRIKGNINTSVAILICITVIQVYIGVSYLVYWHFANTLWAAPPALLCALWLVRDTRDMLRGNRRNSLLAFFGGLDGTKPLPNVKDIVCT